MSLVSCELMLDWFVHLRDNDGKEKKKKKTAVPSAKHTFLVSETARLWSSLGLASPLLSFFLSLDFLRRMRSV